MTPEVPEVMTISRRGFAPVWRFRSPAGPLARAVPARRRTARVDLPGGRVWMIIPEGTDGLRVLEDDRVLVSAERLDPWGRRWELSGNRFSYALTNRSTLKGRWTLGPPGAEIAELRMWTTRRMHLHAQLPVPLEPVVLAWYVIIRMAFTFSSVGPMLGARYRPGVRPGSIG